MIETLNTIKDLKIHDIFIGSDYDNTVVYVKGYYNEGDGGEGIFIYKKDGKGSAPQDTVQTPNDGTIIKSSVAGSPANGRWFRQYSGHLNILFFGVIKDEYPANTTPVGFSNSDKIQAAINYVNENFWYNKRSGEMTLLFPNGTYFIDKPIELKSGIKLLGGKGSMFVVLETAPHYDYIFKLAPGPIVNTEMENFVFDLKDVVGTGGIHLKGIKDSKEEEGEGGAWTCSFKNIRMNNCKGHGIHLEGGETVHPGSITDYFLPNQYINFENVWITRKHVDYNCLKITGQLNTSTFINCIFEAPYFYDDVDPGLDGVNVLIESNTDYVNPCEFSFINCATGGHVRYGYKIKNVQNITFDTCWFEDIDISIDITNSSGINISNCRFANAAGQGSRPISFLPPGTGRCISVLDSSVTVENNYVTVSNPNSPLAHNERFITGIGNNNVINAKNNSFQDIRLSETIGIVQNVSIQNVSTLNGTSTSGIETLGKKIVFVKVPVGSTNNIINRINSTIIAGETIFIRADQGSVTFNEMSTVNEMTGKNFVLNGRATLTLSNGQAATFIKLDGINGNEKCCYQLVSISN
ncbi:hypothetical protein ABH942_001796 [Flavobacterium sp. 28YEA47A]|uniref:hypothetical protein n=1 Tax=Flavobacterium sp. 28YEA47A TaxID=3156276 RepID=UPI0035179B67